MRDPLDKNYMRGPSELPDTARAQWEEIANGLLTAGWSREDAARRAMAQVVADRSPRERTAGCSRSDELST
jgi:hypothetical protein